MSLLDLRADAAIFDDGDDETFTSPPPPTPRDVDKGLHCGAEATPTATPQQRFEKLTPRSGSRATQRKFLKQMENTLGELDTPRDGRQLDTIKLEEETNLPGSFRLRLPMAEPPVTPTAESTAGSPDAAPATLPTRKPAAPAPSPYLSPILPPTPVVPNLSLDEPNRSHLDQHTPRSGSRAAQRSFLQNLEARIRGDGGTPREGTPRDGEVSAAVAAAKAAAPSAAAAARAAGLKPTLGKAVPQFKGWMPSFNISSLQSGTALTAPPPKTPGGAQSQKTLRKGQAPSGGSQAPAAAAAAAVAAAPKLQTAKASTVGGLDWVLPAGVQISNGRSTSGEMKPEDPTLPPDIPALWSAPSDGAAGAAASARTGDEGVRGVSGGSSAKSLGSQMADLAAAALTPRGARTPSKAERAAAAAYANAVIPGTVCGSAITPRVGSKGALPVATASSSSSGNGACACAGAGNSRSGGAPQTLFTPGLGDLEALAPPLPLPRIISLLGLKEKQVCNIWCGGSRLWGCNKPTSDYDLYVVHRAKEKALRVATCRIKAPVHIDATLLHADEWADRLKLHNPLWLLLTWHPLPWMLRLDPSALGFAFTPQVLLNTMLAHQLREWARVRKYFHHASPDVASGRETLTHLLRTYVLVLQLCTSRRVIDFRAGEPMRIELSGYADADWLCWRDKFEPRLEAMHAELRVAVRRDQESWRGGHREEAGALDES